MPVVKVKIVKIGTSRHSDIWKFVDKIKQTKYSKIFEIIEVTEVALPDADCYGWSYSKESLANKFNNVVRLSAFINYAFCS